MARPFGTMGYRKDRNLYFIRLPTGERTEKGHPAYAVETFKTKRAAERCLKAARKLQAKGALIVMPPTPEAEPLTVSEAVDAYIDANEGTLKPKTLKGYRSNANVLGAKGSPLRGVLLEDLTASKIRTYRTWREKTAFRTRQVDGKSVVKAHQGHTARATVNRDLDVLKATIKELVVEGKLSEDVERSIKSVKRPPETKGRIDFYLPSEAERLIAAASPAFRPVVAIALYTGSRQGEALTRRWRDVDFDRGTIVIERSKTQNSAELPMPPALQDVLKETQELRKAEKRLPADNAYICISPRTKDRWKDIRKAWKLTVEAADVRFLQFHCLRHTTGTLLAARGVPAPVIQRIMGHSTIDMTMRYIHIVDGQLDAAMGGLSYGEDEGPGEACGTQLRYPAPEAKKAETECALASA